MNKKPLDHDNRPSDLQGDQLRHHGIGHLSEHTDDTPPQTDVHLSRSFVALVQEVIAEGDKGRLIDITSELHAADVADILEILSKSDRQTYLDLVGEALDPDVLFEIEGIAQEEVYEQLPNTQLAEAVNELETDEAVYVLEELGADDRAEVMSALDADDRVAIEESLNYPEDSAGRLMQRELVALPEFWTIGQTIDYLRREDENETMPDDFYDVFVVDPGHRLVGTLPVSRIMRSLRTRTLNEIMEHEPYVLDVLADQEEVAYQFTKYHLISAGVVDASRRLVGVITVDDVVEVIEEEAQEDIMALAGVGETGLNESLRDMAKGRFIWLFVNLGTAVLASLVIGLFDTTIEEMVALAILMPIVASMGGNAATQTMTVAVRAIATKDLSSVNAVRVLSREVLVASLNGVILAIISGLFAWIWFNNPMLGFVFASAMVFNLISAGLCGILVPMSLNKVGVDPAIASSVFVTTITDVIGFFAFLGLASIWLM